jgi:hypothetical protein
MLFGPHHVARIDEAGCRAGAPRGIRAYPHCDIDKNQRPRSVMPFTTAAADTRDALAARQLRSPGVGERAGDRSGAEESPDFTSSSARRGSLSHERRRTGEPLQPLLHRAGGELRKPLGGEVLRERRAVRTPLGPKLRILCISLRVGYSTTSRAVPPSSVSPWGWRGFASPHFFAPAHCACGGRRSCAKVREPTARGTGWPLF